MASLNFKKSAPHLLIIGCMLAVCILYCLPAFTGKKLAQGDKINYLGMSHEARQAFDSSGKITLWTNSMFGGMPSYLIFVGNSNNYVAKIGAVFTSVLPSPTFYFFIAMVCFYLLMQVLGINKWLAGIGALAYAFSTYNPIIIAAGHDTKMFAIAYMPAVMAGILLLFRERWITGATLTAIAFALMFQYQHFQVIYYFGILVFFMFIGLLIVAIQTKKVAAWFKSAIVTGLVLAIGAGPSMQSFLSSQEYSKESMRGGQSELTFNHDKGKKTGGLDKDYAFRWSSGIGETFSILIPDLYGGGMSEALDRAPETEKFLDGRYPDLRLPLYSGPQAPGMGISGPVYFGAVICFLFVLGLILIESPHKWWIVAVSALAIMMSWGDHFKGFNYFLFDHLPFYNKFRTPSMTMVLPQLLFPLLGIWVLNDIIAGKFEEKALWKAVKISLIITGGLCLVLGFGASAFFDFKNVVDEKFGPDIARLLHEDRASLAMKSGLLSAFYIALAGGLLWAFIKKKIKTEYLVAGFCLLILIDLMPVAWRYLNGNNYEDSDAFSENFTPRAVDKQIMADPDPYYRVLDVSRDTYNDAMQAYFHKCVGGYSPVKMEIYQDLIEVYMAGQYNAQVLNMLNTKYVIVPGQQKGQPEGVIPNPDACGNAWFVNNIKWVNTADEEIRSMNAEKLGDTAKWFEGAFRPKETAIVRNTFNKDLAGFTPAKDSSAAIKLTHYGLDDLEFSATNSKDGLAVFSDIWYPYGWTALIDGKETPIVRTDYVLRAIKVPAGNHKIQFHFHPKAFYIGDQIALVCSLLLYGLLITVIVIGVRRSMNEKDTQNA